jgi:hypothetical protein
MAGNGTGGEIDAAVRQDGDKDVLVLGADVARQVLSAGLLDEGTPRTGTVTHLRYRVQQTI